MQLLRGKRALVTGGTSGIGKSIAQLFLEQGAEVVIAGTHEQRAKDVTRELGGSISYALFDVSKMSEVEEAVKAIVQRWEDRIDILVNCAGISRDRLFVQMGEEEWLKVISVNLHSVFHLIKSVIKPMVKRREGCIINLASVIGLKGNAGQANYAAAKAGIIGLSKSLAKEYAKRRIRVNVIAPGFIATPMTDRLSQEQQSAILQTIPMGRFGLAQEVASVALFLASDLASYITGEVITVDGGMLA